jgi:uncharacterized membrane protein
MQQMKGSGHDGIKVEEEGYLPRLDNGHVDRSDGQNSQTRQDSENANSDRATAESLGKNRRSDQQGYGATAVNSRRISMSHMEMTSGPLPSANEFSKYEQVLPGAADRILRMAEDSLKAEIDGNSEMRKIFEGDRKAENWCLKFTTAVFSLLTVTMFITSIVFFSLEMNAAAFISAGAAVGALIPRIIDSVKGRKTPVDDEDDQDSVDDIQ